jgi:flagellar motor switch protein FliN/FliY
MSHQDNKSAVRSFAAAFANAFSDSVSQAVGSSWALQVMDTDETPTLKAQPVQFRMKVDGALRGECFIEFYEPQASDLAVKLGGSEGEGSLSASGKTLTAVLSLTAAALSSSLSSQYGVLGFKIEAVSGLAFGGMFVVPLAAPAGTEEANVLLYFDASMMEALTANEGAAEKGARPVHPANLKLVMDVELNVSLRFGQRQLPLRDVLELTSGSVVELDRLVDEPVELLLDGKVVARGEAIIVDGNYGLRVTEVPQAIETHFIN